MAADEQLEVLEMTHFIFLLISPKTLNSDVTNPIFFNDEDASTIVTDKKSYSS